MALFALVDCNNFYVACQQLFDPTLAHRPVVVLSNNDGCVVARSQEAKALGIPMGAPWHQLRDLAQREHVRALSSNYALYADLSNRVVEVLSAFTPHLEVYSIDECFLDLSHVAGISGCNLTDYGQQIRQRLAQWLGLPVCVGIATTKTLSKLANHCAKKDLAGQDGVCDFTSLSSQTLSELFGHIEVSEVWGVGPRISSRLKDLRIQTVRDLREADTELIRSRFSVVLERTVLELRGIACLELEEMVPARKQIMCSRSFGQAVYALNDLCEAVASYMARAAEKLRSQNSLAGVVHVYLLTNPFKPEEPQYQRAVMVPLPEPTADSRVLTGWALLVLKSIYRPGFAYKKAGVMLSELRPKNLQQGSLFTTAGVDAQSDSLMQTLDRINKKWGKGSIHLLSEGTRQKTWEMRREHLSPAYSTRWEDLPVARAC